MEITCWEGGVGQSFVLFISAQKEERRGTKNELTSSSSEKLLDNTVSLKV